MNGDNTPQNLIETARILINLSVFPPPREIMLVFLFRLILCCFLADVGVGGYTYLLEPLWWAGMVTSKYGK